jgi:LacI family transcriptional regulator
MRDVAKLMNVSVTTVSKAINDHKDISAKTKDRVFKTIHEIGYIPNFMASNLRRKKGNMVALVLSDISTPFFSKVIQSYEKTLSAAGYQILIFGSYENAEKEYKFIRQLSSLHVAGIILDLAKGSTKSVAAMRKAKIPYVLSNRYIKRDEGPIVAGDNIMAGYIATKHLLCRKPGASVLCVNGPDNISPTAERHEGYRMALAEAGAEYDAQLVFDDFYGLADSYEVGLGICEKFNPPFSIFCSTDLIAIGVLSGLRGGGLRVPEDVGVIGVDDIEMSAYLNPPLSTISLQKELIGAQSAEILIGLMEGREITNPIRFLSPELIERQTT